VQVRCSEGVAIHTDPESCAVCREAAREALTGARIGEVSSGESNSPRGADAVVACRRQQARVRHREDLGTELRASRETSRPSTMATLRKLTAATSSLKPSRATLCAPDTPRS
jgi:hypothetical protein